jgi:hypothetical protein
VCLLDCGSVDPAAVLAVSAKRISLPVSEIPLALYMREITEPDGSGGFHCESICSLRRPPMEAAWVEIGYDSEFTKGHLCKRVFVGRAGSTRAIITLDFKPADRKRMEPVWDTVIETIVIGDYLEDPRTGRRREKRG